MNNTWCRIAACVFFCMASSASAASAQETGFVHVALEQLHDRMERDDKGTLDEFVADVSTASGLSEAASRDSLVSLLRNLKTHCKKSTALGEQLFALHGALFSEREAKSYLVRVVDMASDLLKKEENVGLEPLIAKAASKSKLLKFQALDYTKALLVSFVGSPVAEESAEEEGGVNAPTGTFKVLVRTRNSESLSERVDQLVEYHSRPHSNTFFRVFKVPARSKMEAERKILALHESVRLTLLDEFKRFSRVRSTTDTSTKDIRYILDYVVYGYWVGGYNTELLTLQTDVQLVVQDVLKDEAVLEQTLNIKEIFTRELRSDDESILDEFYQEAARTVAQEVSPLFE